MTQKQAITILQEMQKWRRGLSPYDGDTPDTHRDMPYSPKEFGEAIDTAIECMTAPSIETIHKIISLCTEYRYGSMMRTESEDEFITKNFSV